MHEGRKQTNTWSAYAGSRLELSDALGRRRPKRHPSSRTGENPPYGMIGGIEETSASFEARSAPRSYPTRTKRFARSTWLPLCFDRTLKCSLSRLKNSQFLPNRTNLLADIMQFIMGLFT